MHTFGRKHRQRRAACNSGAWQAVRSLEDDSDVGVVPAVDVGHRVTNRHRGRRHCVDVDTRGGG